MLTRQDKRADVASDRQEPMTALHCASSEQSDRELRSASHEIDRLGASRGSRTMGAPRGPARPHPYVNPVPGPEPSFVGREGGEATGFIGDVIDSSTVPVWRAASKGRHEPVPRWVLGALVAKRIPAIAALTPVGLRIRLSCKPDHGRSATAINAQRADPTAGGELNLSGCGRRKARGHEREHEERRQQRREGARLQLSFDGPHARHEVRQFSLGEPRYVRRQAFGIGKVIESRLPGFCGSRLPRKTRWQ